MSRDNQPEITVYNYLNNPKRKTCLIESKEGTQLKHSNAPGWMGELLGLKLNPAFEIIAMGSPGYHSVKNDAPANKSSEFIREMIFELVDESRIKKDGDDHNFIPIFSNEQNYKNFYEFANDVLWPIFHSLLGFEKYFFDLQGNFIADSDKIEKLHQSYRQRNHQAAKQFLKQSKEKKLKGILERAVESGYIYLSSEEDKKNFLQDIKEFYPKIIWNDDLLYKRIIQINIDPNGIDYEKLFDDTLFIVHDYQCMLIPELVRRERSNQTIGYFHHIPFPSTKVIELLPQNIKNIIKEKIDGILGADYIGFHTEEYKENLIACIKLFYPQLMIENENHLNYQQRTIRLDVNPIGINYQNHSDFPTNEKRLNELNKIRNYVHEINNKDVFYAPPFPTIATMEKYSEDIKTLGKQKVSQMLASNHIIFYTADCKKNFMAYIEKFHGNDIQKNGDNYLHYLDRKIKLDTRANVVKDEPTVTHSPPNDSADKNDHQLYLSMSRLDLPKGIPQVLEAVDLLFQEDPEFLGKFTLILQVIPSRMEIRPYQELNQAIHTKLFELECKYGNYKEGWKPIRYINTGLSFDEYKLLQSETDGLFITTLKDGFNLIAAETIASREKSKKPISMILSEGTGIANVFSEGPLFVPEVNKEETLPSPQTLKTFIREIKKQFKKALKMPHEEKIERTEKMQTEVKKLDLKNWFEHIISETIQIAKISKENNKRKFESRSGHEENGLNKKPKLVQTSSNIFQETNKKLQYDDNDNRSRFIPSQ